MEKDIYKDKVEISVVTLIEINRAFRGLKNDKNSYIHKVFMDDYVFCAMKEIDTIYRDYFEENNNT